MEICDCCGKLSAAESLVETHLEIIKDGNIVKIPITVPVISCSSCKMEYTDSRAEDIRAEAAKLVIEE